MAKGLWVDGRENECGWLLVVGCWLSVGLADALVNCWLVGVRCSLFVVRCLLPVACSLFVVLCCWQWCVLCAAILGNKISAWLRIHVFP